MKARDAEGNAVGPMIRCNFETFQNKYQVAKVAAEKKFFDYPARCLSQSIIASVLQTQAYLTILVIEFFKAHSPSEVLILEKPKKTVVVNRQMLKHEMILPFLGQIHYSMDRNEIGNRDVEIKGVNGDFIFYIKPVAYFPHEDKEKPGLVASYNVQSRKEVDEINAEVTWVAFSSKLIPKGQLPKVIKKESS